MLDVCDTYDNTHYPVYVLPTDDLEEAKKNYSDENMQKIYSVIEINPYKEENASDISPIAIPSFSEAMQAELANNSHKGN